MVWFCGWPIPPGLPLSETEHESYRKAFETTAIKDEMTTVDFEDFMQKDDGATVALVVKLKFRDELKYPGKLPEDFVEAEDVDSALATLQSSSIWLGLQAGNVPVAIFNQQGNLIRPSGRTSIDDEEVRALRWRYRSEIANYHALC